MPGDSQPAPPDPSPPEAVLTLHRTLAPHPAQSPPGGSIELSHHSFPAPQTNLMKTKLIPIPCRWASVLLGLVLAGLPAPSRAAVPAPLKKISYQGYLVDANGVPLGDTEPRNYDATFKIYSVSSGGTALWSESQTITVDNGNFSLLLGEATTIPDNLFATGTAERYVGITVKGLPTAEGVEILPRVQFLTSPYAMVSAYATKADEAKKVVNAGGSTVLTVTTSGTTNKVGINTATPRTTLDVNGTIVATDLTAASVNAATVTATMFRGSIGTSNLVGVIPDGMVPNSVARRNTTNTFTADQTVSGTMTATSFVGNGTVPIGAILMWAGTTPPTGWRLCAGGSYNGVTIPDLRNRFVVGSGGTYVVKSQGGAESITLTADQVPVRPHTHTYHDYYDSDVVGTADNTHGATDDVEPDGDGTARRRIKSRTTTGMTQTTPNVESVSILPPYYALAFIIRVQ